MGGVTAAEDTVHKTNKDLTLHTLMCFTNMNFIYMLKRRTDSACVTVPIFVTVGVSG